MPLDVVYTKSYNIWDDINPFLRKLGEGYAKSQETKWNNEWQLSAIADIEKANKPQEVNSFLEMQKIPKENLDLEGFKGFADEAMGMLAQKEMTINPEDFPSGVKPITDISKMQTKTMPDVQEFNNLYKFVSELPTGKVDWSNTMGLFKEKLESGRAMGTAAQQFLSMIMGQSMPTNQRQKVQQDFSFTQDIRNELFPEQPKPTQWDKRLDTIMQLDPSKDELKKFLGIYITPEKKSEFDKKLDIILKTNPSEDELKKFLGTYIAPERTTGLEKTIEDIISQGNKYGISKEEISKRVKEKIVGTETPSGGTGKLVPTFGVINSINDALLNPGNDYDTELHNAEIKYNLEGVKLATKADQAKNAYGMFERILVEEEYIDEEGFVNDEIAYSDYYNDYEKYAKKYFKETGEILPKKFLSIEEAGKYTKLTWGEKGYKGGQKPVINTENIPWSWQEGIDVTEQLYNEIQRTGTKPEDYDLERLAKERGVDIDKLLQMCSP